MRLSHSRMSTSSRRLVCISYPDLARSGEESALKSARRSSLWIFAKSSGEMCRWRSSLLRVFLNMLTSRPQR